MVLVVGGMALGLWVDSTAGLDRRQSARVMLRALLPGLGIALLGFVLGRVVFSFWTGSMARGWGTLVTVLAVEVAAGWVIQTRSPRLAQVWSTVRGAATQAGGPLAAKVAQPLAARVTLPDWLTNAWGKVRGWLPVMSSGGWFTGLTLTTAVGVAGTLVLLTPLAGNILGKLLSVVACIVAWIVPVVVILALVVWYVRRK
jgi:hypothetical protein